MKKQSFHGKLPFLFCTFFIVSISLTLNAQTMSKHAVKKWFSKKQWLNGAAITPGQAIDKKEFARQYFANRVYWDEAFQFIKMQDLQTIPKGKYPIDSTNVYASITADSSKDFEKTQWESHRKYIDLQFVIIGEEKMGECPVADATVIKPYDANKDVANYTADGKIYSVPAGTFMIFFPSQAHRPNITPGGNKVVKKLVIKIRAAE